MNPTLMKTTYLLRSLARQLVAKPSTNHPLRTTYPFTPLPAYPAVCRSPLSRHMSAAVENGDNYSGLHIEETTSMSKEDHYMRWRREGVLSIEEICGNIRQMNGRDLIAIKLADHVNYVTFFIVVTANSTRHLRAMAQSMNQLYKEKKQKEDPYTIIEGKRECRDWQCIELGNSVVHFMLEEARDRYQLEKLWLLGHEYDDLIQKEPSQGEILGELASGGLKVLSSADDDDVMYLDADDVIDFPSWDDQGEPVQFAEDGEDDIDEDDYVV